MLKALSHPLPLLLALETCAVLWYWLRFRGRTLAMIVITTVVVLVIAVSMPVVAQPALESLALPPVRGEFTPDYIVVLSGGYEIGASPESDLLSTETMKRVLYGVQYWKEHPTAQIVMTGAGHGENLGRETELMAAVAEWRGVPAAAILREPMARNTREHPIRLRAMGIGSTKRLAVVTSPWHERRAMVEFRRYFVNAVPQTFPLPHNRGITVWIPDSRGLAMSTDATQEWVGIVWYRVLAWTGR